MRHRVKHLANRAAPITKLASEFTIAHIITRLMAALSGLILVRLLPIPEYGFYTLLLAGFTFICTFSDLGVTETLGYFRRRALKKNRSWTAYFEAVVRFRKIVFLIGFTTSAFYLLASGSQIHEEKSRILLGVLIVGAGAWFAIQSSIKTYALKLEQRFRPAYLVEICNESVKLLVVGIIWLTAIATALMGILGVSAGAFVAALIASHLYRANHSEQIRVTDKRQHLADKALLGQVLPILPGTIHFTLGGIFTAWLAAYYGSAENVAEVGALGRLGVLIGVITGFIQSIVIPRLIFIQDEALFFKRYLQWSALIVLSGLMLWVFVWHYPGSLLILLGQNYSGLRSELMLVSLTAIVSSWGVFVWLINRARGWVRYQEFRLPIVIAGQILMFTFFDFSKTSGVLLFGLGTITLDFLFQLVLNLLAFNRKSIRFTR